MASAGVPPARTKTADDIRGFTQPLARLTSSLARSPVEPQPVIPYSARVMSDPTTPAPHATPSVPPTAADVPLISAVKAPSSPLVRTGGFLGILGCAAGLGLLFAGCAGYSKALQIAPFVVGAGTLGLLIVLLGALFQRRHIGEDTHVLQGLFACMLSIIGGVLEMAMWLKWPILK